MPKRTQQLLNSNIDLVGTAESFKTLIEMQRLSVENSIALKDILYDQGAELEAEVELLTSMNKSMMSIATSLKNGAPAINSSTIVNNSNSSTAAVAKSKEDKNEAALVEDKMLKLLSSIEKNTRYSGHSASDIKDPTTAIGLGGFATAIAVALGGIVGSLRGQLKTIGYFSNILTPVRMKKAVGSFAAGLSMTFDLIKSSLFEKFSAFVKSFDPMIDTIKLAFSMLKDSKLAKIAEELFQWMDKVFDPIKSVIGVLKDFFSGTGNKAINSIVTTIGEIGKSFNKFANLIGKSLAIFGKLFYPFTVIMTVWDTVKGSIEGFEKEGIVGGISGAIKGFFNALVFGPIDMIKDAIGWVMGVFGFDNAKRSLESFNLEKLFSDFVDTIFHPIDVFKKILKSIVGILDGLKDFTIPELSFTLPVINKKVVVGPFKPFANAVSSITTDNNTDSAALTSADVDSPLISNSATYQRPLIALPTTNQLTSAQNVTSESNKISVLKERVSNGNMTTVIAPSVNNNMKQTQIAKIEAPVRSTDSSLDRYFSARIVY